MVCSSTPRFSYGTSETSVSAFWNTSPVVAVGCGTGAGRVYRVGVPGGYTGWVIQGPTDLRPAAKPTRQTATARERALPCRGRVVWMQGGRPKVFGGWAAPGTTLRARSDTRALPVPGPLGMPPLGQ